MTSDRAVAAFIVVRSRRVYRTARASASPGKANAARNKTTATQRGKQSGRAVGGVQVPEMDPTPSVHAAPDAGKPLLPGTAGQQVRSRQRLTSPLHAKLLTIQRRIRECERFTEPWVLVRRERGEGYCT